MTVKIGCPYERQGELTRGESLSIESIDNLGTCWTVTKNV
jgi:hypothetical protein